MMRKTINIGTIAEAAQAQAALAQPFGSLNFSGIKPGIRNAMQMRVGRYAKMRRMRGYNI